MTDLEARLRSARERLPEPDPATTDAARKAMHAALDASPWASGEARRRRGRWGRSRPLLLAAALAVAVAGGALAASGWSVRDLPPFGGGDRDVPEGVGHTEALSADGAARASGGTLPPGAVLADPLPHGKVVVSATTDASPSTRPRRSAGPRLPASS